MGDLRALETEERTRDIGHLKLLSTFHFVGVGLAAVGMALLFGHYTLFYSMMSNPELWQKQGASAPPVEMLVLMRWMYVVVAIGIAGTGVLNLASALFIRARKHRIFSLVVAAINCFYTPLGTLLGVFTIVVLVRDSVRNFYRASEA